MKTGRNDPCPCGSGKKFKKCCIGKATEPVDLLWRRLGDAHDRVVDRLMEFAKTNLDGLVLHAALDEFYLWPDEALGEDAMKEHESIFIPWLLFNWTYEMDDVDEELPLPPNKTIAEYYSEKPGVQLDTLERRFLEATVGRPFSFYEALSVEPGKGFCLKNILTLEKTEVLERLATESVKEGDIIFARLVHVDHICMIIGCGSIIIPPDRKMPVLELRNYIHLNINNPSDETLNDYDIEIRELYLSIYDSLNRKPTMLNSDGDPLCLHTIYYDIDSPEIAFSKLYSLCVVETKKELLENAKLDKNGNILQIEIPWGRKGSKISSSLDNTVLGKIFINNNKLKIEVNSAKRAEAIKKKIEKRLGSQAVYRTTRIKSVEKMLAEPTDSKSAKKFAREQEELMKLPEVQEKLREMLMKHWENWVDQVIPALGGKTPRQAIKTPDGREMVEALLVQGQRYMKANKQWGDSGMEAIQKAIELLGI